MIDQFTREEFENVLPVNKTTGEKMWKPLGIIQGEYSYLMPVDDQVGIMIRSSIGNSGISADSGDDSLRAWLVTYKEIDKITGAITITKPLGGKVSKWTTRVSGWEERFISGKESIIRTLWWWRKRAGDCPHCGKPKGVFKVKKEGPNKGRVFSKCRDHNYFQWITEPK